MELHDKLGASVDLSKAQTTPISPARVMQFTHSVKFYH